MKALRLHMRDAVSRAWNVTAATGRREEAQHMQYIAFDAHKRYGQKPLSSFTSTGNPCTPVEGPMSITKPVPRPVLRSMSPPDLSIILHRQGSPKASHPEALSGAVPSRDQPSPSCPPRCAHNAHVDPRRPTEPGGRGRKAVESNVKLDAALGIKFPQELHHVRRVRFLGRF